MPLLLCLLLTACGDSATPPAISGPSTPFATVPPPTVAGAPPPVTATAAPVPPAVTAPGATLTTASGVSQAGWAGSFCLDGQCVTQDESGLIVPAEALVVAPQEAITFTLENGAPQLTTMRVLSWQPTMGAAPAGGAINARDAPLLALGDLEPSATPGWEAPPMAGDYILDMSTVYEDGDTLAYTWHIVVR